MTLPRGLLLPLLVASLALAGCGDDDDTATDCPGCVDGGGPTADSSTPGDSGAGVDAFVPRTDSGTVDPGVWDCSSDPGVGPGEAITAEPNTWTWVPFDDAFCSDGSTTGIGVNLNPDSSKLLIFMEGGGACFDFISCIGVANPNGYGESSFQSAASGSTLGSGITDRDDPNNPFADWNFVYVPYCTGDAHSGTNADGYGGRTQVGHRNFEAYMPRVAATFDSVDEVVLGGRSAGGLGTVVNYEVTASAFGCTPVHVLNDSGALLDDAYLRPCLQSTVRGLWGVEVPDGCEACTNDEGGGLVNAFPYLARRYPDRNFALLSYTADGVFRQFYSYGYSPGCDRPTTMPPEDYEAGLDGVRALMSEDENFQTFYVEGSSHTFTGSSLDGASAGGVSLADWLEQFRSDDPTWTDVGP